MAVLTLVILYTPMENRSGKSVIVMESVVS